MKAGRVVLSIILIGGLSIAWGNQIRNINIQKSKYENYIAEADKYVEMGLFQKSISSYEEALAIKDNNEVRYKLVGAYQAAYEEGLVSKSTIISVVEQACEVEEDNEYYWETLIELCLEKNDYDSAYKYLNKLNNTKAESERLLELRKEILYSYKVSKKTYSQYYRSPNGYYTLYDGTNWGVMNLSGEFDYKCEYGFITPISNERTALFVSEKGNRVIDKDGVIQALVEIDFEKTRAYADGLLPVCTQDGKWQYYDCSNNEYVFDGYEEVSSFSNNHAIVKSNNIWKIIDRENQSVSDEEFEDVKLYSNGDYVYGNIMIASQNGKYGLYDSNGKSLNDFSCQDADIYLGDYIAFKDETGKWGYVDEKGKIAITPQFEKAKSFSNGLAAVYDGQSWGYINKSGTIVIEYQFVDADYFTEKGITLVSSLEGLYYMIKLRFT